jgi:membrane fusion protein (multidrug efflux system)/multidrug efflux system membrane fusion protein
MPSTEAPRPALAPAPSRTGPGGGFEFLGVVLARASADVAPRFQGRLQEVRVRLGDHVAANSVIAVLDVPTLRHDLLVAEAGLKTAEVEQSLAAVELAEAKERMARSTALYSKSLSSGEDLSTARYQQQRTANRVEAARATIAEHQSQVDRLRKENEDAVVRSPFDGVVAVRYVDAGGIVSTNTPIVRLISANDLIVRFAVPESQVSVVSVGARVRVVVRSGQQLELHGTVEKVAPEIDAASRMLFVEAGLSRTDAGTATLSGEMARVSMEGAP